MRNLKKLLAVLENNKKNICYGAGKYGQEMLTFVRAYGFDIDCFVISGDSNGKKVKGIPVVNINHIVNISDYNWLICVSGRYLDEIDLVLKRKKIKPDFIAGDNFLDDIAEEALQMNKKIQNVVSEEKRCFIMGTGGSLNFLDIRLLHNEDVFSCSFCSLLEDYKYIAPRYYILPALTGDWAQTEEDHKIYIREKLAFYSQTVISPLIFCDYNDKDLIQTSKGFQGKQVFYLYQKGEWEDKTSIYDLCKRSPVIQTGSIMMLKVAMYMGYKKIYLIGTEHDLYGKSYGHAYNLMKLKELGFDSLLRIALSQNQNVDNWSNREKLRVSLNMYNQYYYLHNIAKKNGIQIFNATNGGSLDEFERVEFNSLFV